MLAVESEGGASNYWDILWSVLPPLYNALLATR